MAKRIKPRTRKTTTKERKTNWLLIGGMIGVGVVALFALLFASLQGPGAPTPVPSPTPSFMLAEYCAQNPGNCVAEGADNAQITIVEVSDYGCGHCKNFNLDTAGTLKAQYVDSGQVRWVVMPYALGGTGSGFPTAPSANAAMCANEQGAFPQFHTALFANQSTSAFNNEAGFLATAESLNLDLAAFQECVENGRFNDTVLQNIQTANQAGINSTPSFFVNGELVRGNVPLANFQQIIDAQLGS